MKPTTLLRIQPVVRLLLTLMACSALGAEPPLPTSTPNIVLIFADDLGYADIGVYGAQGYQTPHLDRLAREGIRFTDFYVAQAVCSASRAALLTGCYPNRIGILGALGPKSATGIHDAEVTLAELLKARGYATGIVGKWHLGDDPQFLPLRHGFDDYLGLPYSNDMWPKHPTHPKDYPPLPLIEGDRIIETMPDQTQLVERYTQRALRFIEQHRSQPFFLYVAHNMPHVPLFASDRFRGRTARGLYGDVITEIDASVGRILDGLKQHALEHKTLVIFTSDNGPWLSYGEHAGRAHPLREGKGTAWEGGVRVPCVMRWPGVIPAGALCREMAAAIDLLPTLASLTQAKLPTHAIDGKNIWPLITAPQDAKSPHEALFFYWGRALEAVRSGPWKLHFPHEYRSLDGRPGGRDGQPAAYRQLRTDLALYDLSRDVGETNDLAAAHPDIVARLQSLASHARKDLGDALTRDRGAGVRAPGRLAKPQIEPTP